MSKFPVSEAKESALINKMKELNILEKDIEEKFIKGSGAGGQKINKTSSCVYLYHRPTGVEVRCQQERSQALNRFLARRELCFKIENILKGRESAENKEAFKRRKQKARRSRRSKAKMLADKRKNSEIKAGRAKPTSLD